jgi:hypothetical protein
MLVARKNLYLPTVIFGLGSIVLLVLEAVASHNKKSKNDQEIKVYTTFQKTLTVSLLVITIFDLFRFAYKFLPFTEKRYLYPSTKAIKFLQKQPGNFRIMTTDDRILTPNFSVMYKLQSIEGYDPLYLRRYGELIAASQRGMPNIDIPFGFNRTITPHNVNSQIIDLLGVKYILSLNDISSPKMEKIYQEGETRIYKNNSVFPRVFFIEKTIYVKNKQESIDKIFQLGTNLKRQAVVEYDNTVKENISTQNWSIGKAEIIEYAEDHVIINTDNDKEGFLVLIIT